MPAIAPTSGLTRSRYVLLSPQPYRDESGTDAWFAYATRSASLVRLSAQTAASLRGNNLAALDDDEITRLRDLRILVDEAEVELSGAVGNLRAGSASGLVRTVTIMPTAYCNMACSYCGQEHFKAAHDQERMERVAARVEAMLADPAVARVEVTWFGGEPLLAFRVIRELSTRFVAAADAHGKQYAARMATNGSLLTARTLQLLHDECRLVSVEITIDGPEAVHDARRKKRNGIGSFHRTVAVLAQAVRERSVPSLMISIRMNIDHENEAMVPDLINDLACFGFGSPQVRLHLIAVHSWGNDVSDVELAVAGYAQREVQWLRQAEALGLNFTPLPTKVITSTCLATTRSGEIIDSQGRIYSCSEHPQVPVVRDDAIVAQLTDLVGSQLRPAGRFDDWYDQIDDGKASCSSCPILPVCGGACPKLWRDGHIPCPSMKFNWQARIDIAAGRLGFHPVSATDGPAE